MIKDLIEKEAKRQKGVINLIASENYCSDAVKAALASDFTNKYAEGYPGKRYYAGNAVVDELENYVCELAQKVFQTDYHVNVQPYSGSIANLAVYWALLEPGDTIMGLELSHGGHLTHGHPVTISGKLYHRVSYGVDPKTEHLDYDEIERIAKESKPKLIISGASAYPRQINFERISKIAHEVGAYHMADISHISGLVATGLHPTPFGPSTGSGQGNADVITTTTHKLLRGPRGALVFAKKSEILNSKFEINSKSKNQNSKTIAELIDKAVFPGIQGGPHMNTIAAIGVCLEEALKPEYEQYNNNVLQNAQALSAALVKEGLKLVSGGTDNHLMLIDLRPLKISGQEAQDRLEKEGIIVNKNAIPFDESPPQNPSGIRLGTPAITTRGMSPDEMPALAKRIVEILKA